MNKIKLSGLLFFLSGAIVLMGIITAEAFYPSGYTTFENEISDLGATRQPNSISFEPSSTIFNTIMWLAGIMVLVGSFFQHTYFKKLLFSIPVSLFGLGLFGVGIFPGNITPYHGMSAMLTFLSGGFCAIISFKIVGRPFKYIAVLFGSIALTTWFMAVFASETLLSFIGIGGTERWVAYPIMLWLTGIGGYLMHDIPNEKYFNIDKSGDDLDVPRSELHHEQERLGSEDEENNYYSLGGNNHNDLE